MKGQTELDYGANKSMHQKEGGKKDSVKLLDQFEL